MRPRRQARKRKIPGVGEGIQRELMALSRLVLALNKPQGAKAIRPIVEATHDADTQGGPPPPFIPPAAAALYNKGHFTQTYRARAIAGAAAKWAGVARLVPDPAAADGALLHAYFENPVRDRLRRCEQCARWFIDATRNKGARRCSRACTIAWTNGQRPKKGGSG
jgi:hypothetical protein